MAALARGAKAPNFSLPTLDGKKFSLQETLRQSPVLAIFFKVSCPVCQYAFPYFERVFQAHGNQKIAIVGVSQDDQRNTASFLKEFGVTFPTLLDEPKTYPASNAYGITNVPTWFLIGQDGEIEMSSVGWVKKDVEELNCRLAELYKTPTPQLFKPGEDVREFRSG